METTHRLCQGDARSMADIAEDAVELVVTSPPYPMIEMWDETFRALDNEIDLALESDDGITAFRSMHDLLDTVWTELARVVVDGGLVCINVADATRSIDGTFRSYPNVSRVTRGLREAGFELLPGIVWRKPANSSAKFMGSGMVPPNAYVTLEHEAIIIARNGATSRSFEPKADRRYEAAYFWEERNRWFSDLWTDVRGIGQATTDATERDRSGAFPITIPYRLCAMYSVYGDTVLDPFLGTGTTSLAAASAARNSIGIELDPELLEAANTRLERAATLSRRLSTQRLEAHAEFVATARADGDTFSYSMTHYDMPVKTAQETDLRLYEVTDNRRSNDTHALVHGPVTLSRSQASTSE